MRTFFFSSLFFFHVQSSDMMLNSDFDCLDMYKQPAFAHPLLKNHKIQVNRKVNSFHVFFLLTFSYISNKRHSLYALF